MSVTFNFSDFTIEGGANSDGATTYANLRRTMMEKVRAAGGNTRQLAKLLPE